MLNPITPIEPIEPIRLSANKDHIELINQLLLPNQEEWVAILNEVDCAKAIKNMLIRGAPAIGVSAAYGFALAFKTKTLNLENIDKVSKTLLNTRPTAVNLNWAIKEMQDFSQELLKTAEKAIFKKLFSKAIQIHEDDKAMNYKIGQNGLSLFQKKDKYNILTHCNAGSLATGGYGTALGVIYSLFKANKLNMVYVDETRPYLQGARLTAYELDKANLPYTVICDNMAGALMKENKLDAIITGADRIAKNGDTANKIGTYSLAVLANYHKIPFYIAAPSSTFDQSIQTGLDIPIEIRPKNELGLIKNYQIVKNLDKIYNPSFDITDSSLINAIITNQKVYTYPYNF